jgi:hypothetical protein
MAILILFLSGISGGVALFLIAASQPRPSRLLRLVGGVLGLLGLAGLFSLCSAYGWDGGYPYCEYRITFVSPDGKPVQGVRLSVETPAGHVVHFYPVSDFLPDDVPTSGPDGLMVFHHGPTRAVEYGGTCRGYEPFQVGTCHAPQYVCRFLRDGREVARRSYVELVRGSGGGYAPPVARVATWYDGPYHRMMTHLGKSPDPSESFRGEYCGGREWPRERSLAVAWSVPETLAEQELMRRDVDPPPDPAPPTITFPVAQLRIVVAEPPP